MKVYSIKIETRKGEYILDNVEEYVFCRKYMYYCTTDDTISAIPRGMIIDAYRRLEGTNDWLKIRMKQYSKE